MTHTDFLFGLATLTSVVAGLTCILRWSWFDEIHLLALTVAVFGATFGLDWLLH